MIFLLKLLGYIWSLPLTIIGLCFIPIYGIEAIYWYDGCIEIIAKKKKNGKTRIFGEPWGQTWGYLTYYDSEEHRKNKGLRVHERFHTVQGMILGILFIPLYVAHFLWLLIFTPGVPTSHPRWYRAYYAIWAEKQARKAANAYLEGKNPVAWGSNI